MNEQDFLIDLVFKPKPNGMKLYPAEIQLLLAYIGEILKEVEEEEQRLLIEAQRSGNGKETSCK